MKKKTLAQRTKARRAARAKQPIEPLAAVSKKETVLALLRRPTGATIADLMQATRWQAHSVRGFISGTIRKRLGLTVTTERNTEGALIYHIAQK